MKIVSLIMKYFKIKDNSLGNEEKLCYFLRNKVINFEKKINWISPFLCLTKFWLETNPSSGYNQKGFKT